MTVVREYAVKCKILPQHAMQIHVNLECNELNSAKYFSNMLAYLGMQIEFHNDL